MPTERELFYQHLAQTTPFPLALEIEQAEGIYLYGKDGKKYMNLIPGIAVSNITAPFSIFIADQIKKRS